MEKLRNKLKDYGGFTLIEMLIVVAIIAILVAVSIPLVNSALERARESTDAANERSFKAVLTISYTNGKYELANGTNSTADFDINKVYAYDAANGTLSGTVPTAYGKSTAALGIDGENRKGHVLYGYVSNTGKVRMCWLNVSSVPNQTKTIDDRDNLISPKMVAEA